MSRRRRADVETLGTWDEYGLAVGPPFPHSFEALDELWAIHGESFLARWIAEEPGTRPWSWWEFEAEEPRREVNPPPCPDWFGAESGEDGRRAGGRILFSAAPGVEPYPWLEEERDYLSRLGLLEPGEAEAAAGRLPPFGSVIQFGLRD